MEGNRSNGREESPAVGLGLELGCGNGRSHRPTTGLVKSCGFTIFQLQELQLQALIFSYMEAGLPLPHHLVLPIWNSVSASLAGLPGNIYQCFPSFSVKGPFCRLGYKHGVDPEPGRCKRTDGKKWRCSKEAIPDEKYCERHMHRGRNRSRKLMEAAYRSQGSTNRDAATTNLSISLPVDTSSSSTTTNLSPASFKFGFSPKSVLLGGNPKTETSLHI